MQQTSNHSGSLRFRRYTRKGYAVFASLHKVVTIGELKGETINGQDRKDGAIDAANQAFHHLQQQTTLHDETEEKQPMSLLLQAMPVLQPAAPSVAAQDTLVAVPPD